MLRKHVIGPGGKRVLAFEPENEQERREMAANKVPLASEIQAAREAEVNPPPARRSPPATKPAEAPAAGDSN